jgi:hypothetical protein
MNRELWSCTNDDCRAATWLVQRSIEQPDLWRIAAGVDATPFNVAAAAPVCPYCGTTLEAARALERDARPAEHPALAPTLAFS